LPRLRRIAGEIVDGEGLPDTRVRSGYGVRGRNSRREARANPPITLIDCAK
jgi:hypothetical protein